VRHDRQIGGGEERLHDRLVHADGRPQHAGPDVGHVGELEQALHGAVLAVGAVEHRKHHVHARALQCGRRIDRHERLGARLLVHVGGRQCFRSGGAQGPAPVLGDLDRDSVVAGRVEVLEDGRGRRDRYLVFAGATAVDDADAQFFHVK